MVDIPSGYSGFRYICIIIKLGSYIRQFGKSGRGARERPSLASKRPWGLSWQRPPVDATYLGLSTL